MAKVLPLWQQYAIFIPGTICIVSFGNWVKYHSSLQLSRFRDKSALYGRELQPGEPPSWP